METRLTQGQAANHIIGLSGALVLQKYQGFPAYMRRPPTLDILLRLASNAKVAMAFCYITRYLTPLGVLVVTTSSIT